MFYEKGLNLFVHQRVSISDYRTHEHSPEDCFLIRHCWQHFAKFASYKVFLANIS